MADSLDRDPTSDEMVRVRRYECRMLGHDFENMMVFGNDFPEKIICKRCGKSANVVKPD